MVEAAIPQPEKTPSPQSLHTVMQTPPPSFRDMLRGTAGQPSIHQQLEAMEEDDEVPDDDLGPEDLEPDDRCPVILLTKEEKKQMRQPWKNSLIIKMFDGNLGYMGLMRRLKKKWNIRGELALTDIGHKYFIARFTNKADYNYVVTQGPWMLDDSYLTIRKWVPNFVPDDSPITVLTAWVLIPNLAVEYFDINFLNKIGSKIGKVLRVDRNTAQAERGQFTRLSVEIDLTKPLLSKFWLKGRIWRIQYEGLRMVCFKCGKLGHNEEACNPAISTNSDSMAVDRVAQEEQMALANANPRPEEKEDFGSWMLVKKPIRKRYARPEKTAPVTGKTGNRGARMTSAAAAINGITTNNSVEFIPNVTVGVIPGSRSRFSILEDQVNKEVETNKETNYSGQDNDQVFEEVQNSFNTVNLGDSSQNRANTVSFNLGNTSNTQPKSKQNKIFTKAVLEKKENVSH